MTWPIAFVLFFSFWLLPYVFPGIDATEQYHLYVRSSTLVTMLFAVVAGVSAALVVLAKLLRWTLLGASLRALRWAASGLAICLVVQAIVIVVPRRLPPGSGEETFSSIRWSAPDATDRKGNRLAPRQLMLKDVVEQQLPGLSREQIEAILGPSEVTAVDGGLNEVPFVGGDINYHLGVDSRKLGSDDEWLLIWLDEHGRFARFHVAKMSGVPTMTPVESSKWTVKLLLLGLALLALPMAVLKWGPDLMRAELSRRARAGSRRGPSVRRAGGRGPTLGFVIALIATLAVGYQNRASWAGFLWATIHGVGPGRFLAFAPVVFAFALIWVGYAILRRRPLAFAVYAFVLLGINEALVPGSPVKTAANERALESVEVSNVRDEPLLTARGNPIGIRFHIEATFPSAGPFFVSPSALVPVSGEYPPYELQFGSFPPPLIEPPPSRDEKTHREFFQPGIHYKFTYDLRPNFVDFRSSDKSPCLARMGRETFSEEDFDKALARSRHEKLRTDVLVHLLESGGQRVAQPYTMVNEYDLEAMRRTITLEAGGHCEPIVKRTGYTRLMTRYERAQAYRGTSGDYVVKGAPLLKVQRRSTSLFALNPHSERLLVDTRTPSKDVSTSLVDYGEAMLSPDGGSVAFLDHAGDAAPTYRLGVYDLGKRSVSWPFQVSEGQTEFHQWMDDNSLFVQYYKVGDVAEKNWFSWMDRDGTEILHKGVPLATALTDVSEVALSLDGKTYVRRDRSGEKPWFHCDSRVEFKFYGPPGDTLLVQETAEGRKDVALPCQESCIRSAGWDGIPKLLGCRSD